MPYRIPDRERRDLTPEEVLSDATGEVAARLSVPIGSERFVMFSLICLAGLFGIFLRVVWLSVVHHDVHAQIAENNRLRSRFLAPNRGLLFDRFGRQLVENIPTYDLLIESSELPADASLRDQEARALAEVLSATGSGDVSRIRAQFDAAEQRSLLVAEDLPSPVAISFAARHDEFDGVVLAMAPRRFYGDAEALYHILGSVGRASEADLTAGYRMSDFVGKSGIEASYETLLRGTGGLEQTEVTAKGEEVRLLSRKEAQDGEHLVLAIDADMQRVAYEALQGALKKFRAPGGAVVAVDPRDGSIRALVSAPSIDANRMAGRLSPQEYQDILADPRHPFFNRAIAARYPAGSTIKPFMGAAALAEGIVTPNTIIEDRGAISVPSVYDPSVVYTFRGYATLGPVDIFSAIARSSDIYFYIVGGGFGSIKGLGIERIAAHLDRFGFGKISGIAIGGEEAGLVPTSAYKEAVKGEPWRIGDTYNVSIGQGDMGVTPLQLALATAAIANGGTLWQPRLVDRTVDGQYQTLRDYAPIVADPEVASSAIVAVIRKAMRQTVTNGTARLLGELPVAAAAKTGTAQTGKLTDPFNALVTVFAPYENPEIALAIVVEKAGEGNEVAVPIARDILMEYFKES
ncbi:MAG: penicillin-binding protein 2 [bacterium]|nr:penicillin-binding protein 2 [bacterium]